MQIARLRTTSLVFCLIALAPAAHATPNEVPLPAADPGALPPSRGFQGTIRTGLSFPVGAATGAPGDGLGRRYAWQVPVTLGLGAKVTDAVFIGAYLGLAFGAEGSDPDIEAACRDRDDDLENDISCSALSFQLGVEGHYSFEPGERWNPWIGYGVGFEASQQSIDDRPRQYRETQSSTGFTMAKVSVGIDHRARVGFGPFAEVAVGQFTRSRTEVGDLETHSGTIDDKALHAWLTFGLRMVLSP